MSEAHAAAGGVPKRQGTLFDRVCLIGLGLIGSSLALGIRANGLAREIIGVDQNADHRAQATERGLADRIEANAVEGVRGADLVILCIPVGSMGAVAAQIAPHMAPGAVLSDVGSVKGAVWEAVSPFLRADTSFIPAHPIAGTEHSGPRAGFATLFRHRWCILCPAEGEDPARVDRLEALWAGLGALVDRMSAAHHDRVLAVTSHLPHLIAYTIVGTADDLEEVTKAEVIKYSAGGFRDFTRIAASDPVMWRDVFLANREATLELLGRFTEDLFALQRAIRWGDAEALEQHFERTREIRRGILDLGQDTDRPDFGRRPNAPAVGGKDA
ncbi:MAG: prephenate/arogenate dehydrogenase family protein [Neomegalonema sp.]|nr:prephenate/arogenate dehydrogenase family protein [Neomegalonema sp.]